MLPLKNAFQKLSVVCLWVLLSFAWGHPAAWAHRPHDVVTQVKVSPTYAQNQTIFNLVRGNLFQSTDGGNSWQRMVEGLDNQSQFSTLTIDDTSGQTLAVATTGDGIYRSDDGGYRWSKINQGLRSLDINLVQLAPGNPDQLLAAGTDGGLYRTANGGQLWTTVLDNDQTISALAFETPEQIFAGTTKGQVLRSTDGGLTWNELATLESGGRVMSLLAQSDALYVGTETAGILAINPTTGNSNGRNQGLDDLRIQDLAAIPGNPQGLMASTWDKGIYTSTDGGRSWKNYPKGLTKDKMADDDGVTHFSEIAISDGFATDQTAFVGGFNGLYKSTDGGKTWAELETLSLDSVVAMDVSPNYVEDGTVAIATYVGKILISEDRGETWRLSMEGVEVPRFTGNFETPYQDPRRFFDIAFSKDYGNDQTIFTATLWTKFLKTTNKGETWSLGTLDQEVRGMTLAVSPNFKQDKTVFLTNQSGLLFKSENAGKSFKNIGKIPWRNGNDGPSIVLSPNFAWDDTLFAAGESGVYKSTNGGQKWDSHTAGRPLDRALNIHIAVSPNFKEDQTVLASSTGGLFRSTDAGDTWTPVLIDNFAADQAIVDGVAISPDFANDQTVLISVRGHGLYKSTDGSNTFSAVGDPQLSFSRMVNVPSAGTPIHFSPNYAQDQTIFGFGSANGDVFRSTDGGESWMVMTTPDEKATGELSAWEKASIQFAPHRGKVLKLGLALFVAMMTYGVVSVLHLEKILPVNRWIARLGATAGTFAVAIVFLLKVL